MTTLIQAELADISYIEKFLKDLQGCLVEGHPQKIVIDTLDGVSTQAQAIKRRILKKQVDRMDALRSLFRQHWREYAQGLDHGEAVVGDTDDECSGRWADQDKSLGFLFRLCLTPGDNCQPVDEYSVWIEQDKVSGLLRGHIGYMNDGDEVECKTVNFTIGEGWGWEAIQVMLDRAKSSIGVIEERDLDDDDDGPCGGCGCKGYF